MRKILFDKRRFLQLCGVGLALTGFALAIATPSDAAKSTAKPTTKTAQKKPTQIVVIGKVQAFTRPPRPGSVPYKDAIVSLHITSLKTVSGKAVPSQIVVFVWGMKNKKWTRVATLRKGQSVRLRLTPWEKVERKYGSYNRFELDAKELWDLDTYWAEML